MIICSRMLVFANFLDKNFIVVPTKDTGHKYYNQINYKKFKLIIVIFEGPTENMLSETHYFFFFEKYEKKIVYAFKIPNWYILYGNGNDIL